LASSRRFAPVPHSGRFRARDRSGGVVSVIGSTTIKRYAALHADAAEKLLRWNKAASHAVWRDVNEIRLHFPDADQYKSLLIFNIRHNYYRLIAKVDYRAMLLMVQKFLAHKEYAKRAVSTVHAKQLAEFFNVSGNLFI
jgi:mRNA interferase HigB